MPNVHASAAATEGTAAPLPERRPWGLWTSLILFLLIFEGETRLLDVLERAGLRTIVAHNIFLQAIYVLADWGLKLALIVAAVWMTRLPLRAYVGWTRPRLRDVAIGVAVIVGLFALVIYLIVSEGGGPATAEDYRAALARGTSPWWYVL